MKLKLFIFAVVACMLAFTSCTNNDDELGPPDPNPTGGKIKVSFNVKDYFTSEVVDKSGEKATLQEAGIKVVQYRVLDWTSGRGHNDRIYKIQNHQVSGNDLTISDELPAGNYLIFFIGATKDFPVPDIIGSDNFYELAQLVALPDYNTEIFSNQYSLTLTASMQKVEEDITLKRAVGRIEIEIEDAQDMPAEVGFLYPMVKSFYPNVARFVGDGPNRYQSW